MSTTEPLTAEMKDWFGDGEYDIDLMLRMGAITEQFIVDCYRKDKQSPGYIPESGASTQVRDVSSDP